MKGSRETILSVIKLWILVFLLLQSVSGGRSKDQKFLEPPTEEVENVLFNALQTDVPLVFPNLDREQGQPSVEITKKQDEENETQNHVVIAEIEDESHSPAEIEDSHELLAHQSTEENFAESAGEYQAQWKRRGEDKFSITTGDGESARQIKILREDGEYEEGTFGNRFEEYDPVLNDLLDNVEHRQTIQEQYKPLTSEEKQDYRRKKSVSASIQALCKSKKANLITKSNWRDIGLQNYHGEEYNQLIQQMWQIFPDSALVVAFAEEGDICLGSEFADTRANLDQILMALMGHPLEDFFRGSHLVEIGEIVPLKFFQAKAGFSLDAVTHEVRTLLSQAELIIEGQFDASLITNLADVSVNEIAFIQEGLSVIHFGYLQILGYRSFFHHTHDIFTEVKSETFQIIIDQVAESQKMLSLHQFITGVYGLNNSQEISEGLQLRRGLESIQSLGVQSLTYEFDRAAQQYFLSAELQSVQHFAIAQQLQPRDCRSIVRLRQDSAALNRVLLDHFLMECALNQFPDYLRIRILKEPTQEKVNLYVLDGSQKNLSYQEFSQVILYRLNPQFVEDFSPQFHSIFAPEHTFVSEIRIALDFHPKIVFGIQANLAQRNWLSTGEIKILFLTLNDRLASFVEVYYGNEPLVSFLGFLAQHRLPAYTVALKTYFFYASQTIDIKEEYNYLIEDFGPTDRTIWQEGWELQHKFTIPEPCQPASKICRLLGFNGLREREIVVRGHLTVPRLVLQSPLPDLRLTSDLVLRNAVLQLCVNCEEGPLNRQIDLKVAPKPDEFLIFGEYDLPVSTEYTIPVFAYVLDSVDNQLLILNAQRESWPRPFNLSFLNFNQLIIKGFFQEEEPFGLKHFSLQALSIFGNECFFESISGVEFRGDSCFFGNSFIKIDFRDFSNNFFQGYIKEIKMIQILSIFLGYETGRLYELTSKSILDIEFLSGVQIAYAEKIILESSGSVRVPKGTTIQGSSRFLGLEGRLVLNIDQGTRILLGVFHFPTISLAEGNLILFEQLEKGTDSNNIIIRLGENSTRKEEQILFRVSANLFDRTQQITIHISEQLRQSSIEVSDTFFGSPFPLDLIITGTDRGESQKYSLLNSAFSLSCTFRAEHLASVEQSLKVLTERWLSHAQEQINFVQGYIQEIGKIRNGLREKICNENICPKQLQCEGLPQKRCTSYKQRQVCVQEELVCLDLDERCTETRQNCIEFQEVCVLWGSSKEQSIYYGEDEVYCLKYERQCKESITTCERYESVCSGEKIRACSQFQFFDDENQCEEFHFGCELTVDFDRTCQHECQRRAQQFEYYDLFYHSLEELYALFEKKNLRFFEMFNQVEGLASYLKIIDIQFKRSLDKPLSARDFNVVFQIQSFRDIEYETFIIDKFDFEQNERSINRLFRLILEGWIQKYKLDPIILGSDGQEFLAHIFHQENIYSAPNQTNNYISLLQKSSQFLDQIYSET